LWRGRDWKFTGYVGLDIQPIITGFLFKHRLSLFHFRLHIFEPTLLFMSGENIESEDYLFWYLADSLLTTNRVEQKDKVGNDMCLNEGREKSILLKCQFCHNKH